MLKKKTLLTSFALLAGLSLAVVGCKTTEEAAPQSDQPQAEQPQGDHPKAEHPKGEHPAGEHPSRN